MRAKDYNGHTPMEHDEIVAEIQRRATSRNIFTHYCGKAQRCQGRGAPDLVCVGKCNVAWLEIKTPYDNLKPEQTAWMYKLKGAGQAHHVIRETHLDDGTVDAILDGLAFGQSLLFGAA